MLSSCFKVLIILISVEHGNDEGNTAEDCVPNVDATFSFSPISVKHNNMSRVSDKGGAAKGCSSIVQNICKYTTDERERSGLISFQMNFSS